jgi:hypothetical protein
VDKSTRLGTRRHRGTESQKHSDTGHKNTEAQGLRPRSTDAQTHRRTDAQTLRRTDATDAQRHGGTVTPRPSGTEFKYNEAQRYRGKEGHRCTEGREVCNRERWGSRRLQIRTLQWWDKLLLHGTVRGETLGEVGGETLATRSCVGGI